MVCNDGETISYVSSGFIFYLFLMRNLLIDFAFFYLLFNRIRMLAVPYVHQASILKYPQNENFINCIVPPAKPEPTFNF
ncbi:hypothetical protein COD72_21735 [Bacillus cereus]|nr:hypothetical protein COD72_21735 [Bacillus cereus]